MPKRKRQAITPQQREQVLDSILKSQKKVPDAQFHTVQQFSKALVVSEKWVRRAIARRDIAIVRVGHHVRIPATELARFVEQNMIPAEV
jgi:excisionase family DNA binding protein